MRLSTRSRYGLRMVMDIAQHEKDGPVSIGEISERQNLSLKYLEKLVRELKKAGVLISRRGARGGHMLASSPAEITVGRLVEALEGDLALVDCCQCEDGCDRSGFCPAREIWQEASRAMFRKLDSITVADLVLKDSCILNGMAS